MKATVSAGSWLGKGWESGKALEQGHEMIRPTLKEAPSGCLGGEDNGEKRPRIGGRGQGGTQLQWGGCGGCAPRRFDGVDLGQAHQGAGVWVGSEWL